LLGALQILNSHSFCFYLHDFHILFNFCCINILTAPCCGTEKETNHNSEEASARVPLSK
jgi:uncharacterized membrane protein